jgi:hypothetical protein
VRVPFDLKDFEPFTFSVEGCTYRYSDVSRLAEKRNIAANIDEAVIQTPDGKKVWLTVVGDEDQTSAYGIQRGWYVAQVLPDDQAVVLVKALAPFTSRP